MATVLVATKAWVRDELEMAAAIGKERVEVELVVLERVTKD